MEAVEDYHRRSSQDKSEEKTFNGGTLVMHSITIRSLVSSGITFALVASLAAILLTRGVLADDPIGAITTLAIVPATPGVPEGIVVSGNHVFVSGPATFGTAGT